MSPITLVVPCYNEAARLDRAEILRLAAARPDLRVLLVDDGSVDGTGAVLEGLRAASAGVEVLRLDRNLGKAEAVRQGLRAALARGAEVVGYADADLATPLEELLRLVDAVDAQGVDAVLGSRVRLLGRRIERKPHRHYLGRIFATLASLALRLPVYDTQCGAKVFRATPALRSALAAPFRSRWIFDVELIERLLRGAADSAPLGADAILEVPLHAWRDVGGSKLRISAMIRAALELSALLLRSLVRRRGVVAARSAEDVPLRRTGSR